MRIALVTTSFLPKVGGAEYAVHHLAQQWSQQGHQVRVINNVSDEVAEPDALYSVRRFRLLRGTTRFGYHRFPVSWYEIRLLRRALDEFRPDVISAHFGYPTAMWLAGLNPVPPFLITCHGPALDETPHGPRRRYGCERELADALNRSTRVISISGFARRILVKMGVRPEKLADIPNGADLPRFRKPIRDFDLRERLGIPRDALVVLSVGRDEWEKDYGTAIKAFSAVARRVPTAHYVICGRGSSNWSEKAAALGLTGRTSFCEGLYGDELVGAYQQADIFLMPSVQELSPLVVPEAMAAGLPEVVTNVGGNQDMIQDGENGLVVEPRDDAAMAGALIRLAEDPALRERMSAVCRDRSDRYGWDRISRMYLDLILPKHG